MIYRIKRAVWWVAVVAALGYLAGIPVAGWWQGEMTEGMIVGVVFWVIVFAVLGLINERHGFLGGPRDDR